MSASATTSAASTTTSSGGSTSSGAECTPNAVEPCYSGPIPTKDVGACKSGMRTCDATGTFGACVGEIVPVAETCATPEDDDCDGMANEEGDQCVCLPGASVSCYTGPANTMGVGLCAAGTTICDAQGQPSGSCDGQVLPALENCLALSDEDCDGVAQACTGTAIWAKRFGDAAAQTTRSIATLAGGLVITGSLNGSVDFGGGALTSAGSTDVFVARYDADGNHVWSKRFGDAAAQTGVSVAVDAQGNVIVAGDFSGKIDLGSGALSSAGSTDVFVAKFDSTGALVWANRFGDNAAQSVGGIAVDITGDVIVTGSFSGTLSTGLGTLVSAGASDVFLLRLDGTAATAEWAKSFGNAATQAGVAVATGPSGEIALVASNAGVIDIGLGALTSAGGDDVMIAEFTDTGAPLWGKQFGSSNSQVPRDVTIDPSGNVVAVGSFQGQIDFGGGALTSAGATDIFLAKFTNLGVHLWGKRFGAAGTDTGRAVSTDPFGAVVVAGDFSGSVDFGGGTLVSAGGTDVVVAKLDPLGSHVWSRRAGDAAAQTGDDVATDATTVFLAGTFAGSIDLGLGALIAAGSTDVFLAALEP